MKYRAYHKKKAKIIYLHQAALQDFLKGLLSKGEEKEEGDGGEEGRRKNKEERRKKEKEEKEGGGRGEDAIYLVKLQCR